MTFSLSHLLTFSLYNFLYITLFHFVTFSLSHFLTFPLSHFLTFSLCISLSLSLSLSLSFIIFRKTYFENSLGTLRQLNRYFGAIFGIFYFCSFISVSFREFYFKIYLNWPFYIHTITLNSSLCNH